MFACTVIQWALTWYGTCSDQFITYLLLSISRLCVTSKVWIKSCPASQMSVCVCLWQPCAWQTGPISGVSRRLADICLSGVVVVAALPSSSSSFLVSPQIWIGMGAAVCSPSDSAEIITVQPSPLARCYISPLIRLLRGVVDQLRSLYPDHSTTATPPFGDMINKSRGLRCNNTVICYRVLFVSFSSLPAHLLRLCLRRKEEKVKVADGENMETWVHLVIWCKWWAEIINTSARFWSLKQRSCTFSSHVHRFIHFPTLQW